MICVDELCSSPINRRWRYKQSCHLFSDQGVSGDAELRAFARRIGLLERWIQNSRGFVHFDLTASMRSQAIREGARPVDRSFIVGCARKARGR